MLPNYVDIYSALVGVADQGVSKCMSVTNMVPFH